MAENRPKDYKIYQQFPYQDGQKFTQNWDFGLKINHLATLIGLFFEGHYVSFNNYFG
jgi:hypothetical protein